MDERPLSLILSSSILMGTMGRVAPSERFTPFIKEVSAPRRLDSTLGQRKSENHWVNFYSYTGFSPTLDVPSMLPAASNAKVYYYYF